MGLFAANRDNIVMKVHISQLSLSLFPTNGCIISSHFLSQLLDQLGEAMAFLPFEEADHTHDTRKLGNRIGAAKSPREGLVANLASR